MKKRNFLPIAALSLFSLTIFSCNNDDDDKINDVVCKINNVVHSTPSGTTSTKIEYDDKERVLELTTTGMQNNSKLFSYSGTSNTYEIFNKNLSGDITSVVLVALTNDNKLSSVTQTTPDGSDVLSRTDYTYDANGNLRSFVTIAHEDTTTTKLRFNNGNLTERITGKQVVSLTYDKLQSFKAGDYLYMMQMLQTGYLAVENDNLVTTITTNNEDPMTISYEMDGTQITKLNIVTSEHVKETIQYTYVCK